jgi:catechol 2,3-dioxygenase-like lactoylglutathione lyase family enzyme
VIRLHHVQVSCPTGGEAAAREFYGDLLGLVETPKPPALVSKGGVWFRGDGYELHVGVQFSFVPARKAHPAFIVDDLDALAHRMSAAGVEVTWDDKFPGYRRFHLFDPHGNRIEIMGPA